METTELIHYRRALKRKNYSTHTVKTYMNILDQFMKWLSVPLAEVTRNEIGVYVDHLLRKRRTPKTITCHLQTIRLFFDYLMNEEGRSMLNPVTRISLRLPKPLPRHLKDDQVPLDGTTYRLGKKLTIDPKTELSSDEAANQMFTREYRKGWEYPEAWQARLGDRAGLTDVARASWSPAAPTPRSRRATSRCGRPRPRRSAWSRSNPRSRTRRSRS